MDVEIFAIKDSKYGKKVKVYCLSFKNRFGAKYLNTTYYTKIGYCIIATAKI
jgi:hypothetical protein